MGKIEKEPLYDYSKYPITDIYFVDAYSKEFICEPSLKSKVGFIIDSYYTEESENPTFILYVYDENKVGEDGKLIVTDNLICSKNMTDLDLIYYNSNLQRTYKKALQLDSFIKNNPDVDIDELKEELFNYTLSQISGKYTTGDLERKKKEINRRLIDLFSIYEKITSPENIKAKKVKTRSLTNEIINNN